MPHKCLRVEEEQHRTLIPLCQINMQARHTRQEAGIPSAMDGNLKPIHGTWIPAIHAGMTILVKRDHVI